MVITDPSVARARLLGLGRNYILAISPACSTKILLNLCNAKTELANWEGLCWQCVLLGERPHIIRLRPLTILICVSLTLVWNVILQEPMGSCIRLFAPPNYGLQASLSRLATYWGVEAKRWVIFQTSLTPADSRHRSHESRTISYGWFTNLNELFFNTWLITKNKLNIPENIPKRRLTLSQHAKMSPMKWLQKCSKVVGTSSTSAFSTTFESLR